MILIFALLGVLVTLAWFAHQQNHYVRIMVAYNLEQAISSLKAEREAYVEAYMELQSQAFVDTVALRTHLANEEQQCRGADEFRASEVESESEQLSVYLVRAQEIAGMEQQVADQAARVSHAEHCVNEEHAAICRHKQVHDYEVQQELDRLRSACSQSRIEFLDATKVRSRESYYIWRDEHISDLWNRRTVLRLTAPDKLLIPQMMAKRKGFVRQWISCRTFAQC